MSTFQPENDANSTANGAPGAPVLAPKAQKEVDLGLKALQENKLDDAQKHLNAAAALAPSYPDVSILLECSRSGEMTSPGAGSAHQGEQMTRSTPARWLPSEPSFPTRATMKRRFRLLKKRWK